MRMVVSMQEMFSSKRDAEHAQTEAVQHDYLTISRALTSSSMHSININKMLEECHILLSLQKKDLKVWEAKDVEEQVCGLHSFIERDLLAKLEELRVHVAGVDDECAVEAGELSALVIGGSNVLVDLRMLPIWDIP
jgi:hypothetical protein